MADELVTVTIADDCELHHHRGREVGPGAELEIWASQAERLLELGVINPFKVDKKAKSKRGAPAKKDTTELPEDDVAPQEEEATTPTEG